MVAELCESAVRFQEKGGASAVLPGGASSGNAMLPGTANDLALFVYGNVEVKNLVAAKFGPGIQFEVLHHLCLTGVHAAVADGQSTFAYPVKHCLQHVAVVAQSWRALLLMTCRSTCDSKQYVNVQ